MSEIIQPPHRYEDAGEFAELGYPVIPVNGKRPVIPGWQNTTPADYMSDPRFARHNVGIVLGGPHNLINIDIDIADEEIVKQLKRLLPPRAVQKVGRPPRMSFFARGEQATPRKSAAFVGGADGKDWKLEILGEKQQSVVGGIHPDTRMAFRCSPFPSRPSRLPLIKNDRIERIIREAERLMDAHPGLARKTKVAKQPKKAKWQDSQTLTATSGAANFIQVILTHLDPDLDREDWIKVLAAIHFETIGAESGRNIAGEWSRKGSKWDPNEFTRAWESFSLDHEHPAKLDTLIRIAGTYSDLPLELQLLDRAKTGATLRTFANVARALYRMDAGQIVWDRFRRQITVKGLPFVDEVRVEMLARISNRYRFTPGAEAFWDGLKYVALCHQIDPVTAYLKSLQWDGQPRVDRLLTVYFGAEDNRLNAEVGKRWLISAVVRGLNVKDIHSTAKCDHVLVLIGPQGCGKSTGLANLAPDPSWYTDSLDLDPSHVERASFLIEGIWIAEIGEIDKLFTRRNQCDSTVKNWLSRTSDRFRKPYQRAVEDVPRRCVFAGTSNQPAFLSDLTGNRRFWIVNVDQVQMDAIKRDRDQIWAEAVHLFKAGHRWWFEDKSMIMALMDRQDTCVRDLDYEDEILEWIEKHRLQAVTIALIKNRCLDGRASDWKIINVLSKHGWIRNQKRSRISGHRPRLWLASPDTTIPTTWPPMTDFRSDPDVF